MKLIGIFGADRIFLPGGLLRGVTHWEKTESRDRELAHRGGEIKGGLNGGAKPGFGLFFIYLFQTSPARPTRGGRKTHPTLFEKKKRM